MDRRAKEAEIARRGPQAVDDAALVNQIGQAAMLQAHVRFLVEAIATTFAASIRARPVIKHFAVCKTFVNSARIGPWAL